MTSGIYDPHINVSRKSPAHPGRSQNGEKQIERPCSVKSRILPKALLVLALPFVSYLCLVMEMYSPTQIMTIARTNAIVPIMYPPV